MEYEKNILCVHHSESQDIYWNLAIEEHLLLDESAPCPLLIFGSNTPCVVIGRHQNPWRECALKFMRAEGIRLARRMSGGGAVFHDPGNLNYSFITSKDSYNEQECHAVVMRALADLGLSPELRNKNSIFIEGKKISGTAFCHKRDKVAHHGTLLIDADLETLRTSLRPADIDIETHAVASIPSPVANLNDFDPSLDRQMVADAIAKRFAAYTRRAITPADTDELMDRHAVEKLRDRLASREWCLGNTPRFTARICDNDGVALVVQVQNGRTCAVEGVESGTHQGLCFSEFLSDFSQGRQSS